MFDFVKYFLYKILSRCHEGSTTQRNKSRKILFRRDEEAPAHRRNIGGTRPEVVIHHDLNFQLTGKVRIADWAKISRTVL